MNHIDCRQFHKLTGAAVWAASTSGRRSVAAQTAAKRPLKKAVNLGMVKTEGSTIEKFKLLKGIGFGGVELNRPGGPPVDEILKAGNTAGLPVGGIMNSDHWKLPLSDPGPTWRRRADLLQAQVIPCT